MIIPFRTSVVVVALNGSGRFSKTDVIEPSK